MATPLISILTPTWNRASYLDRVWNGLNTQTFRQFEWIVADDGSTDETESVTKQLAAASDFYVIYLQADRHVGKVRMDNEAVRQAKGELILWCDSDDWLLPHALQSIWQTWCSIPAERKDEFVGLTALAATERGVIVNPFSGINKNEISWNDLVGFHRISGDMLFCARADALKNNPFPEVDLVIPESVVWTAIGHRLTTVIPEVLKMVEYQASNAISFSGDMGYNRGRAYALATATNNLRVYPRLWREKAWRLITFIRYCIHADISTKGMLCLWGNNSIRAGFWLAMPIAVTFAIKDRLQRKVRKTHQTFFEASRAVTITTKILGNPSGLEHGL